MTKRIEDPTHDTKEIMNDNCNNSKNSNGNVGIFQTGEQNQQQHELEQPLLLNDYSEVSSNNNNGRDDDDTEQRHAQQQYNYPFHDVNEGETETAFSSSSSSSFIAQFAKTKGPPQITFLMMLIAIGLGSTLGVVPEIMTDRFARINHGYNSTNTCSSFDDINNDDIHNKLLPPEECFLGSADAQNAVAISELFSNGLTFLTSSLIGSLSDEYGRRGILIIGLFLSTILPLMLFLTQLIPGMSPWWYYGLNGCTGIVNWIAVALSAMSDVLPPKFRAPGIGLLFSGFSLGISLSPVLAFFFDQLHLSLIGYLVIVGGFVSTLLSFPETLPPEVAEEARRRRRRERLDDDDEEEENNEGLSRTIDDGVQSGLLFFRPTFMGVRKLLVRPFKEMSILNRNHMFRLVSILAFFSGMVSSGDQNLFIYYIEERLGFTTKDVSILLLTSGIVGLFSQAVLLKLLSECIGEKFVVALCFFLGTINNIMYGLARTKNVIYVAAILSSLTNMAFPTISAIKANNVDKSEQGQIQGALYSVQALASGVGPSALRFVQSRTEDGPLGPGSMFVFAGGLYLVAVAVACALPKELVNSSSSSSSSSSHQRDNNDDDNNDEEGDYLLLITDDDVNEDN